MEAELQPKGRGSLKGQIIAWLLSSFQAGCFTLIDNFKCICEERKAAKVGFNIPMCFFNTLFLNLASTTVFYFRLDFQGLASGKFLTDSDSD